MKKKIIAVVSLMVIICTTAEAKSAVNTDFYVGFYNHADMFTYDNDMNIITAALPANNGNLLIVEQNSKYGCIDNSGQLLVPLKYKEIRHLGNDFYAARMKKDWEIFNKNGQLIGSGYDEVSAFSEGMIGIKKDGYWGYITEYGQLAVPYVYKEAAIFTDGLAAVKKDGKYGYINKEGFIVIDTMFSKRAGLFGSGLAPVRKSGHWSYIDRTGQEHFEADYELVGAFKDGLAPIYVEKTKLKVGNILKAAIKFRISFNSDISDISGIDWREDTLKRGYIDVKGNKVIPTNYDFVGTIHDGMVHIIEGDEHGYADIKGKLAVPLIYDDGRDFSDGLTAVKMKKWGYIDKNGRQISEFIYDELGSFQNGMGAVKKDGKWGYVDKQGRQVIEPVFKETQPFKNNVAAVKTSQGWAVINKGGEFIISPSKRYKEVVNIKEGIIMIKNGSKWMAINSVGEIIADGYKNMK